MTTATSPPRISVIIIFLDEARFLAEAIESVRGQSCGSWELLLVDDGSTDGSSEIAQRYADVDTRIRYLFHEGHANRGMSASRNLGIANAWGELIAFLDGDDVWLPHKLVSQMTVLDAHPDVAMVYGPLLRWRRWSGEPDAADHEDLCGVGRRKRGRHPYAGKVVSPPALVPLILADDYFTPAGGLIRAEALRAIGGFEEQFRGMHEDGAAMVKVCNRFAVYVSDDVSYLYRMHPDSCTHQQGAVPVKHAARQQFLAWAEEYLSVDGAHSREIERALRLAWRPIRHPALHRALDQRTYRDVGVRVGRGAGRALLPRSVRDELRRRYRALTAPRVLGDPE